MPVCADCGVLVRGAPNTRRCRECGRLHRNRVIYKWQDDNKDRWRVIANRSAAKYRRTYAGRVRRWYQGRSEAVLEAVRLRNRIIAWSRKGGDLDRPPKNVGVLDVLCLMLIAYQKGYPDAAENYGRIADRMAARGMFDGGTL